MAPVGFLSAMGDLLLPETDAGVVAQLVILVVASVTVGVLVRRNRDALLLVIGVFVMMLGLFGLRTLH